MTDECRTLARLSEYSKISVRQLRRYLAAGDRVLPDVWNGRRRLVLRSQVWIVLQSQRRVERKPLAKAKSLREIVAEVKAAPNDDGNGSARASTARATPELLRAHGYSGTPRELGLGDCRREGSLRPDPGRRSGWKDD